MLKAYEKENLVIEKEYRIAHNLDMIKACANVNIKYFNSKKLFLPSLKDNINFIILRANEIKEKLDEIKETIKL